MLVAAVVEDDGCGAQNGDQFGRWERGVLCPGLPVEPQVASRGHVLLEVRIEVIKQRYPLVEVPLQFRTSFTSSSRVK